MKSVFHPPKIPVYQIRMCCSSTQPRVWSDPGQLSSQTSQHLPGSPGHVAASLLCYRGGTRRQRRMARPHVAGDITDVQFHLMIISLLGLLLANQSKNITSQWNIKITSECRALEFFGKLFSSFSLPAFFLFPHLLLLVVFCPFQSRCLIHVPSLLSFKATLTSY